MSKTARRSWARAKKSYQPETSEPLQQAVLELPQDTWLRLNTECKELQGKPAGKREGEASEKREASEAKDEENTASQKSTRRQQGLSLRRGEASEAKDKEERVSQTPREASQAQKDKEKPERSDVVDATGDEQPPKAKGKGKGQRIKWSDIVDSCVAFGDEQSPKDKPPKGLPLAYIPAHRQWWPRCDLNTGKILYDWDDPI